MANLLEEMRLTFSTLRTSAIELKQMANNIETAAVGDGANQGCQVIAAKKFGASAGQAEQNMLVAGGGAQVGVASIRLMDTLDQLQFFQFFESAINCHEAQSRILSAAQVKYVQRTQRTQAVRNNFNNGAPGPGKTVATGL